jgi:hypothetical protein
MVERWKSAPPTSSHCNWTLLLLPEDVTRCFPRQGTLTVAVPLGGAGTVSLAFNRAVTSGGDMRPGGGAAWLVVWLAASIETPSKTAASAPKARADAQTLILIATFSFSRVAWASVIVTRPAGPRACDH